MTGKLTDERGSGFQKLGFSIEGFGFGGQNFWIFFILDSEIFRYLIEAAYLRIDR